MLAKPLQKGFGNAFLRSLSSLSSPSSSSFRSPLPRPQAAAFSTSTPSSSLVQNKETKRLEKLFLSSTSFSSSSPASSFFDHAPRSLMASSIRPHKRRSLWPQNCRNFSTKKDDKKDDDDDDDDDDKDREDVEEYEERKRRENELKRMMLEDEGSKRKVDITSQEGLDRIIVADSPPPPPSDGTQTEDGMQKKKTEEEDEEPKDGMDELRKFLDSFSESATTFEEKRGDYNVSPHSSPSIRGAISTSKIDSGPSLSPSFLGALQGSMDFVKGSQENPLRINRKKLPTSAESMRAKREQEEREIQEEEMEDMIKVDAMKIDDLPEIDEDNPEASLSPEERLKLEQERYRERLQMERKERRMNRFSLEAKARMIQRILERDEDDEVYDYPGEELFYENGVKELHNILDQLREIKLLDLKRQTIKSQKAAEERKKRREETKKYHEEYNIPYDPNPTPEEIEEELQNSVLTEKQFHSHHDRLKQLKTPPPPTPSINRKMVSWDDPNPALNLHNRPVKPDFFRLVGSIHDRFDGTNFLPTTPNLHSVHTVAYDKDDYIPVELNFGECYKYILARSVSDFDPVTLNEMPGIYDSSKMNRTDEVRAFSKANQVKYNPNATFSDYVYDPDLDDSNPAFDVIPSPSDIPVLVVSPPDSEDDVGFCLHPPPPPSSSPSSSSSSSSEMQEENEAEDRDEGDKETEMERMRDVLQDAELGEDEEKRINEMIGEGGEGGGNQNLPFNPLRSDAPLITDYSEVLSFNLSDNPNAFFDKSKPSALALTPGPLHVPFLPKFVNNWLNRHFYYSKIRDQEIAAENLSLGLLETPLPDFSSIPEEALYDPAKEELRGILEDDLEWDEDRTLISMAKFYDPTFTFKELDQWLKTTVVKPIMELRTHRQITLFYHMCTPEIFHTYIDALENLDNNDIFVRILIHYFGMHPLGYERDGNTVRCHYRFNCVGTAEIWNPEGYELPPHIPETSGVHMWLVNRLIITIDLAKGTSQITYLKIRTPKEVTNT